MTNNKQFWNEMKKGIYIPPLMTYWCCLFNFFICDFLLTISKQWSKAKQLLSRLVFTKPQCYPKPLGVAIKLLVSYLKFPPNFLSAYLIWSNTMLAIWLIYLYTFETRTHSSWNSTSFKKNRVKQVSSSAGTSNQNNHQNLTTKILSLY